MFSDSKSCEFLRAFRAKHCYQCDRCVSRFDHHCPLIEQCVGARNHRQFVAFMVVITMVAIWSFLMAKDIVFYNESSEEISGWGWIWRIGLFSWMSLQVFIGVSMCAMHGYLISTAQTTYEVLQPDKLRKRIAYEQDQRGRFMKIPLTRRSGNGFCGRCTTMLVKWGSGLFACYYPFSDGFIGNWYAFVIGTSLDRKEYFEVEPVVMAHLQSPKMDTSQASLSAGDNQESG